MFLEFIGLLRSHFIFIWKMTVWVAVVINFRRSNRNRDSTFASAENPMVRNDV